jgi:hypothetical protein
MVWYVSSADFRKLQDCNIRGRLPSLIVKTASSKVRQPNQQPLHTATQDSHPAQTKEENENQNLLGGTVVEEWFIQQASNLGAYTEI